MNDTAVKERLDRLIALAHREHYNCDDDTWYGCPKSTSGCSNDADGTECNCGADDHNAEVARIAAFFSLEPPADS